jgi:hypothetical protein
MQVHHLVRTQATVVPPSGAGSVIVGGDVSSSSALYFYFTFRLEPILLIVSVLTATHLKAFIRPT